VDFTRAVHIVLPTASSKHLDFPLHDLASDIRPSDLCLLAPDQGYSLLSVLSLTVSGFLMLPYTLTLMTGWMVLSVIRERTS